MISSGAGETKRVAATMPAGEGQLSPSTPVALRATSGCLMSDSMMSGQPTVISTKINMLPAIARTSRGTQVAKRQASRLWIAAPVSEQLADDHARHTDDPKSCKAI